MNFSIKDLFSKCEKIGKIHFLCSVGYITPSTHLHKMKSFALQETDYWRTTYWLIDKPNWLLPFKKHDLYYSKFNEFLKNVVYFKEIWRFRNFRKILKMKYYIHWSFSYYIDSWNWLNRSFVNEPSRFLDNNFLLSSPLNLVF